QPGEAVLEEAVSGGPRLPGVTRWRGERSHKDDGGYFGGEATEEVWRGCAPPRAEQEPRLWVSPAG
ncbi:MAG: hypothetical protein ACR2IK_08535, partial [Chloroflexota bacterium]